MGKDRGISLSLWQERPSSEGRAAGRGKDCGVQGVRGRSSVVLV